MPKKTVMSNKPKPKLLDEVRQVMRRRHYSIHTERTYCDWIRRYVAFHRMTGREDLSGGAAKIEAFLTDLAINGNVTPSTQNQAMNALVFLYKRVLNVPLDEEIQAVRSRKDPRIPVVLTVDEAARTFPRLIRLPVDAPPVQFHADQFPAFIAFLMASCLGSLRILTPAQCLEEWP